MQDHQGDRTRRHGLIARIHGRLRGDEVPQALPVRPVGFLGAHAELSPPDLNQRGRVAPQIQAPGGVAGQPAIGAHHHIRVPIAEVGQGPRARFPGLPPHGRQEQDLPAAKVATDGAPGQAIHRPMHATKQFGERLEGGIFA
ncbi:MAG: hypothetical protein M3220_17860 [Chloroflexota bacterium]|nr:hypothetical protein [Chloroflexota bacterium]